MNLMRVGRYRFDPGLVPTLATAILLPLLIGLGLWQLGRAEEKRAVEENFRELSAAPPLELDATAWKARSRGGPAEFAHRRVAMSGLFHSRRQYLLDNRTRNRVAGFEVLTVFTPQDAAGGVLVNRGWIPLEGRRDRPPSIPAPEGRIRISGTFQGPRPPTPLLGDSGYRQAGWPKIVQRVELDSMAEQFGVPLLPRVVLLDPEAAGGFVREWTPYHGISVERHQGYAFQWFALATALLVIYLVVNLKRIDYE